MLDSLTHHTECQSSAAESCPCLCRKRPALPFAAWWWGRLRMHKKPSIAMGNAEHMGFLSVRTVVAFVCEMLLGYVFLSVWFHRVRVPTRNTWWFPPGLDRARAYDTSASWPSCFLTCCMGSFVLIYLCKNVMFYTCSNYSPFSVLHPAHPTSITCPHPIVYVCGHGFWLHTH